MPERTYGDQSSWTMRIGWMIAIWTGSVFVLGVAAIVFRLLMKLAGLTTS